MRCILLILSLVGATSITTAQAQMKGDTYYLPAIDAIAEKNQAIAAKGAPLKYAVNTVVKDIYHSKGNSQSGQWEQLTDGSWEYTLRLFAKNATSLNAGMEDFFLPPSAELWVLTDDHSIVRGPYDGSYNQKHGFFWVGDVPADHMIIRITVSDQEKPYLSFKLNSVSRGFYRHWIEPSYINKSGSCNVDVACSEADDWQAQVKSVGRYTFSTASGGFLCTGQLLNNTAKDGTPLFSTADHCGYSDENGQKPLSDRQSVAASIALTWNYQSLTCRAPGSAQSGMQISTSGFNHRQSGAAYLASNPLSDFALVQLNRVPNASYELEYSGWDRRDIAPDSAVAIHHPSGHAKRISFEHDALSVTGYLSTFRGTGTHLRVADWDLGTTEGGSSGSGLWNSDKLFVGQLHGGYAACGNDRDDWYGRLNYSWDSGSNAQSRMKDWLDPNNTGQETLQGTGGCEAPSVNIINNSSNAVGDLLAFSSQVSDGSGDYSYAWDINADGEVDGTGSTIQVRYSQAYVGNINLTVKDSSGCQGVASQAVVVTGAEVQLQQVVNIRENLDQVCGNNDNVIDPGERWSTLLEAKNVGTQPATSAYLALGKSRSALTGGSGDNYGNTVSSCDRTFIDISSTGTLKAWESAGNPNYPADDEGSVLIQLSQAFDHYGQSISQLRASSNGYFSTSSTAKGDAWGNECPLPAAPARDIEGARIAPMHDDLKQSTFYHQSFAVCPRTAETGTDLACEVFLWQGADLWETTQLVESIDVQAILYPATSQWVFQYAGTGFSGQTSTTGMQNAAATDGLTYACNTANSINTTDAVCTFNKNHQPQSSGADFVVLETPVLALGDLAVDQSVHRNLEFAIATDATCGTEFSINHEASVFDEGFNAGQAAILSKTIGHNGQCNVVTNCAVNNDNSIQPKNGIWYNPDRSGNGHDLHFINKQRLTFVSYTGLPDRSPIWYITGEEDASHDQYYNTLHKVYYPGGFNPANQQAEMVGWSNTTVLNEGQVIQVRKVNGQLSAEKLIQQPLGAPPTTNMHTGFWYNASQSGWGESISTIGDARGIVTYLYDASGEPYWTNAWGANDGSTLRVAYTESFCLHCPRVTPFSHEVGTATFNLDDQRTGVIDEYNVNVPASLRPGATWSRSNLPITNLIPPIED